MGINCGILQGSCLGPLLFIIYLNDLDKCLKFSQVSMYADSINITIASTDVVKLAEDTHKEPSKSHRVDEGEEALHPSEEK